MDISARICTRLSQWSPVILRVSYIKVLVPLSCRPQVSVTLIWNFSDHSTPPLRTVPPTLVPTQQRYLGILQKMSSHPRQKRGKKWNEIKSKHWEADLDVGMYGRDRGEWVNGWTDEQMKEDRIVQRLSRCWTCGRCSCLVWFQMGSTGGNSSNTLTADWKRVAYLWGTDSPFSFLFFLVL